LDVGGINYRKEIWGLLKEYEKSKTMTLNEVLDRIMAVPYPIEKRKRQIPDKPKGSLNRW